MSATLYNFQSNLQILVLLNVRFALLHPYPQHFNVHKVIYTFSNRSVGFYNSDACECAALTTTSANHSTSCLLLK